jgi:hypothetical protein
MPTRHTTQRRLRAKPTRARIITRWVLWSLLAVVLIVGALGAWVGVRAFEAKGELEKAQGSIGELKTQALAFDSAGATKTLSSITKRTDHAVELTSDPIWRFAEVVPVAGPNLTAFRELAGVTDNVVDDVVTPLLDVAKGVDPASLAPKDGALDLAPLTAAVPAVASALEGATHASETLKAIDTSETIDQIGAAQTQMGGLIDSVTPMLQTLNEIVPLVAPALGSEAPRTYVLMFQNPAESRALGGTALSFALLKMDNGRIELQQVIPAGFANFDAYPTAVVAPGDGVEELYGADYATFIANVTVRPSFPDTARITQEMWLRQFGYNVDGIISIDPVALSYVLRATDPITMSTGDVLTADTLVPLLLNDVYMRINTGKIVADNAAQDLVYGEAVALTFGRLTSGSLNPQALIDAVMQGTKERRIMVSLARPEETAQLVKYGLTGDLPESDPTTDRMGVYFQDNVGAKMNFYMNQAVHLTQAVCRADGRANYRASIDLHSTVDPSAVSKLSPSMLGNYKVEKVKRGDQRLVVMIYAPPGSEITGASVNGKAQKVVAYHDGTYPVRKVKVTIPAGATANVTYDIVAAAPGARALEAAITPMVNPTVVDSAPLDCATVPAG